MADDHIPKGRFKRLTQIAGMATSVGAGLAADRVKRLFGAESTAHEQAAKRVLETLGTLKGAALKAGQTLSLFANQLPPEARLIVSKLYSQAPKLPYEEIAEVIRGELGDSPEALFAEFSQTPLAAASLGQVHAATLKTGERVAVKVQYPGIGDALENDLQNLGSIMKTVGLVFDSRAYAEEIRRELMAELDYTRERSQLEQFRGFFTRWPDIAVPRAYPEVSSKRVLTMELLEGPTLNVAMQTVEQLSPEERWRRAEQLIRASWGALVADRAVHADAHPGNYVLMTDGRLGVLDFGSVKFLSEPFWRANVEALDALVNGRDLDWVALVKRGGFELDEKDQKVRKLIDEILTIAREPVSGPRDFKEDRTLDKMANLKLRYPLELLKVKPPAEALLVGRGLAGVLQNLRALEAYGDLRPVMREILGTRE